MSRRQVGTSAVTARLSPAGDDERIGPERHDDLRAIGGGLGLDADPGEELALLVGGELRAQQAVDPLGPEGDAGAVGLVRRRVDATRGHDAARPLGEQLGRAVGADPRQADLLALLEPGARLGPEREALGRPPDAHRVEDRGLDDDVRRGVADLAVRAAHHAGDADRALRVRDEERVGAQRAHDVVERLEPLALGRPPDDDRGTAVGAGTDRAASNVWIGLPSSSIT